MNMDTLLLAQAERANTLTPAERVDQAGEAGTAAVEQVNTWWNNPITQEWLIAKPLRILLIVAVALVVHWVAHRIINRAAKTNIEMGGQAKAMRSRMRSKSKKKQSIELDPRMKAMQNSREQRRKSRITTLASVAKSAAGIIIWVWAVLAVLDQVGVNVGPLIASAGVLGVALGFGSQSLVKDFISGVFMLLEDQYGVGDTIDVGDGIIGDVEDISLRITTLRDIDGTLWYVRNGEILRVGNLSDDFSIARIEVPVSLNTDTEKAWDIILNAVTEAAKDPRIADGIIDEPVMNGLTKIHPDYVTYRCSIQTLPGHHWDAQRIIQAKLLNSLREAGLELPYPNGIGGTHAKVLKDEAEKK